MAMYLDVQNPPITGESTSSNPNWNSKIEIDSKSFGIHVPTSMQRGRGLMAAGSQVGALSITKTMDASTPILWYYLAAGLPIDQMTIRVNKPGAKGGPQGGLFEGETYEYHNVVVSTYSTNGSAGTGGLPSEQWSFAFTWVKITTQDVDAQGNKLPPKTKSFDFGAGAPGQ